MEPVFSAQSIIPDPLSTGALRGLLAPSGLQDVDKASAILQHLGDSPRARQLLLNLLPHLVLQLGAAGSPDRVVASLDRFIQGFPQPVQVLERLDRNPRDLEILVRLFAGSQFLTEILLRNPEYLDTLEALNQAANPKSASQYLKEARESLQACEGYPAKLEAVRRFQRRELLRTGAADLLGLLDLPAVTRQLSYLADGIVQVCLEMAAEQSGRSANGFLVVGLGKLGGSELNYSSDIDLLFLARGDASEYVRLGERLIDNLSSITAEGFLYRVDMRLRPWGSVGVLVSSLKGYLNYLEEHARLWEKQALLKARRIAGDQDLEEAFLAEVSSRIFNTPSELLRSSVYDMKQRTETQLVLKGHERGEVKLGEGSIRDIEFVVQFLQLAHGGSRPVVRSRNTLEALLKLREAKVLSQDEARILTEGYVFLRTIEHHLQMMDYRQTHRLPSGAEAEEALARRLGFSGERAGEQFITRYLQHSTAIRAIFLQYIGKPAMPSENNFSSPVSMDPAVRSHVGRMDPSYTETFSPKEIAHHARLAEQLDDERLVEVDAALLEDGKWRVTIVAYDYPGELSLICGLMFVHGLNILGGEVFTYEPLSNGEQKGATGQKANDPRRKIVDVFTVQPEQPQVPPGLWARYGEELSALLRLMHAGQRREARGQLASRVAMALQENADTMTPLYPIEIDIDNQASEKYTILYIESVDTIGFLYELTNALAYGRVYIARVVIDSVGSRVRDVLYVTDERGQKITAPNRLRELRAAIVLTKHFTHLLPHSPNPVTALLHFREFTAQLFERPNWPDELASLERPEVLEAMAHLLGMSEFLWDDFLRMQYANLFPVVRDVDALDTSKTRQQLQRELEAALLPIHAGPQRPHPDAPWINVVNAFKDREMFRIDMRHILGHTREFDEFSEELTDLAEVVVNAAYHLSAEDLRSVYGTPLLEDGRTSQMAAVALGKCGGQELGFASDIELMFIYAGNGLTSGPEVITSAEFYEKAVQSFVQAIHAKREGIFEIDLQLRPYGKAGSMAVSLEAFQAYFAPGGSAWAYERQALVKLRAVAGDEVLGKRIEALRDAYVYTGEPFDVTAMRAMRERQLRHLVPAGQFHPKFSPGGLVDVEYLVQGLQITHGYRNPALKVTNTRRAMAALNEAGLLSNEDYTRLRKGHTFIRWLIDSLRVVRGNAKDITFPPVHSEEFAFLARRLRYGSNIARLQQDLGDHTANILEINQRLLVR